MQAVAQLHGGAFILRTPDAFADGGRAGLEAVLLLPLAGTARGTATARPGMEPPSSADHEPVNRVGLSFSA